MTETPSDTTTTDDSELENDLEKKVTSSTLKDCIYIAGMTGLSTITKIPNYLYTLAERLDLQDIGPAAGLNKVLLTASAAAGFVSGFTQKTNRLRGGLIVYAVSLSPQVYEFFAGDPEQAAKGVLLKTVVFGTGYIAGKVSLFLLKCGIEVYKGETKRGL